MSEPDPTYTATMANLTIRPEVPMVPPYIRQYYELERERTIARLRDLDRLLGRSQTIPARRR